MQYLTVTDYEMFHSLMEPYYREGADADTSQEELDAFIRYLYSLVQDGTISGCVACDGDPVGICLWWIDVPELPFSNKPGWGTILEMGLIPEYRGKGAGRALAEYALTQMDVSQVYVCAYGPAEGFWKRCGYEDRGELASNGLKLLVQEKNV